MYFFLPIFFLDVSRFDERYQTVIKRTFCFSRICSTVHPCSPGAYAAVYKVKGQSQSYAMKVPHKNAEAEEAAEHEIEVMSSVKV